MPRLGLLWLGGFRGRSVAPGSVWGVQAVCVFQSAHPHGLGVVTVDFVPWVEGIAFQAATRLDIDRWEACGLGSAGVGRPVG
ncbi:hypothetical protein Srufu_078820 [Streptomyces libani subsp. rufus]|nr:hypothetical protein Srufu_078820 [Streptomyces libani subsp. rufus]